MILNWNLIMALNWKIVSYKIVGSFQHDLKLAEN